MKGLRRKGRCHKKTAAGTIKIKLYKSQLVQFLLRECMAPDDLKEKIKEIEALIKAAEVAYANALKTKKDYNILKSIRTEISSLKKQLQEIYNRPEA